MGRYLVLLALAKLASSSWVSLSLFLLVCSEVLTDTDVSVLMDVFTLSIASLADSMRG